MTFFLFYRLSLGINHVESQLILYFIDRDICEIIRLLKIKGVFSPPHKCLPHADTDRHPKDLNSAHFNYLISWGCWSVLLNASVLLKEASFSATCSKLTTRLINIYSFCIRINTGFFFYNSLPRCLSYRSKCGCLCYHCHVLKCCNT